MSRNGYGTNRQGDQHSEKSADRIDKGKVLSDKQERYNKAVHSHSGIDTRDSLYYWYGGSWSRYGNVWKL